MQDIKKNYWEENYWDDEINNKLFKSFEVDLLLTRRRLDQMNPTHTLYNLVNNNRSQSSLEAIAFHKGR